MTLACQREHFDIPGDVAYLNTAYMGPLSHEVLEAIETGARRKVRPWEIVVDDFFEPIEEARTLFARVIGGDADGVAIVPSVSYGVAVAAANLPLRDGGRVITLAEQFPSNVYGWREVGKRAGTEVVTVERTGDDWTPGVLAAIDERTDVVALPNCHWADGTLVDLVRVGDAARAVGAKLVLDLTQSLGARPFDVGAVRPDFVISAVYKWLLGPYSIAFLWAAPDQRDGTPIEWNWITRSDSRDFAGLIDYRDTYQPGARRYDVGEVSNFILVPGAVAALRQTLGWGVANVEAYIAGLNDHLAARADALGLRVPPSAFRSRHLLGVRFDGDARELGRRLASERIHVSVRGDAIRVAPHVYNTVADIDRLLEVLGDL